MWAEHEVKGGILPDVVVRDGTSILQMLAIEDETLPVWGKAFLVLDLGLNILGGVKRLNFKCDGLASQSPNKYLHLVHSLSLKLGLRILKELTTATYTMPSS